SSSRRYTRFSRDWSSDVCSSDLNDELLPLPVSYLLRDRIDIMGEFQFPVRIPPHSIGEIHGQNIPFDLFFEIVPNRTVQAGPVYAHNSKSIHCLLFLGS